MGFTRIASFDIGKKNFAFCIEEFDPEELGKIENITEYKRYNADGTPTDKMSCILDKIYANGRIVLHKKIDLTKNCDVKKKLDIEVFHNMIDTLDKYANFWDTCTAFVIEEQMAFAGKINRIAMKLGQHCMSYFLFKYGRYKSVIEFPAYHKTQILGAQKVAGKMYKSGKMRWKTMKPNLRKKWAVEKTIEILTCRGDINTLDKMIANRKQDDLGDVCLQLQAFKYMVYVDGSLK